MKPFYALRLLFLGAILFGFSLSGFAQIFTYNLNGVTAPTTPTVFPIVAPAGVWAVYVDMQGGEGGVCGGFNPNASRPGYGGRVQCVLAVTPGVTYYLYPGGRGGNGTSTGAGPGGFNGGGNGAFMPSLVIAEGGGGGGGASDIRAGGTTLSNRVVVAGGGGGDGFDLGGTFTDNGGDGGGTLATAGLFNGSTGGNGAGQAGTATTGGGGATIATPNGFSGGFGYGGGATPSPVVTGTFTTTSPTGGGGGGGYYGGGGAFSGGGGGGSSYTDPILASSSFTHTQAYNITGVGNVSVAIGVLNTSSSALAFGPIVVGQVSAMQVFSVTGTNLMAAITTPTVSVNAPAGFLVSPSGLTGTYSSSFTVPYTPPTIPASACVPVYVEFAPGAYSTYTSTLTILAGGTTLNVPVTGSGVFACSGAPVITSLTGPASATAGSIISLNATPITSAAGITYQWFSYQQGATGGFSPISGTGPTNNYSLPGSFQNTFFYTVATCSYSGLSTTSSTIEVLNPNTPTCTNTTGGIANFAYAPAAGGCSPGFTTNVFVATVDTSNAYAHAWQVSTTGPTSGFTTIPGQTNALYVANVTGTVWVRDSIACNNPPSGLFSNITGLPFIYTTAQKLTLNPTPVISGSNNICLGTPVAMSATVPGGTWTSTPAVSIAPATGVATGIFPGSAIITYSTGAGCSSIYTASVNVAPTSIIGSSTICPLATTPLTDLVSGGAWTSSATGVMTVGLTSGIVTGVTAGTSIITYTIYNGCQVYLPITDNPLPGAITGSAAVCVGQTDILSDTSAGGVWSSSNTFLASIGSSSGISRGVAAGTTTIAYTLPTGCHVNLNLTVNALPPAITGLDTVCVGSTTTLHDAVAGTWSSSATSLATVGTSGIVTGVAAGIPTVTFSRNGTGCWVTTPVTVDAIPTPELVTEPGGGGFCPGGAGVHIGLNASVNDINYYLYYGSTIVDMLPGATSALDFGLYSGIGTYSVMATNALTGCSNVMTGSATVFNFPVPAPDTVKGGGSYCQGGLGVDVYMIGSEVGTNYQVYRNDTMVGLPIHGIGSLLDIGMERDGGYYTVIATNATTGCTALMPAGAPVVVNLNPVIDTVSAGGRYCLHGNGVDVSLNNSTLGIFYKLFDNGTLVNTIFSTGGPIDFGNQMAAGNYTVMALNNTTSCTSIMADTAKIKIDSLPTIYATTGGGDYCAGGTGRHIGVSHGVVGTNYLLYNGGTLVNSVLGANSGLDFGAQTAAGTYYVVGKFISTGCKDTMGVVNVSIDTLPTAYNVLGTGSYCAGGSGLAVSLAGSEAGHYKYSLYRGTTYISTDAGTGSSLSFGNQTIAGIYNIVALDTFTTCTRTMTGTAVVSINPLPLVYGLGGGGDYCAGGTGMPVMLGGSQSGIRYTLKLGSSAVTMVTGSGSSFSFGLETGVGNYTAIATNTVTGCISNMAGVATIGTLPLPLVYSVSGGGTQCAGGSGFGINLSNSTPGIDYRLFNSGWVGSTLLGDGSGLFFGMQTAAGNYKVVATNPMTGCADTMSGTAPIIVHALPTPYTMTGGGTICAGMGGLPVALSHSDIGTTYILYNGSTMSGSMSGSGGILNFGNQSTSGSYYSVATSGFGCMDTMSARAVVNINPAPTVYTVSGGGTFCANDTGTHIFLSNSNTFVNYQVYRSATIPVGTFWAGTGIRLDLGLDSVGGVYTVKAINSLGCTATMADSAVLVVTPLVVPTVNIAVAGGDTICAGSTSSFSTTSSNAGSGPIYQWKVGSTIVSSSATYSYAPTNGDIVSVMLTSNADCAFPRIVTNTVMMTASPLVDPVVTITTPFTTVCPTTSVTFTSSEVYGGMSPLYSWRKNGVNTGVTGTSYTFTPVNNDAVELAMTSDYPCISHDFVLSNPVIMTMDTAPVPVFTINGGNTVMHLQSLTLNATVTNVIPSMLTYQWSLNGNVIAGANTASYTSSNFNDGDQLCCSIFSTNSCNTSATAMECVTIHVGDNLGVSSVNNNLDIHVLPNPNKGYFTIKGNLGVTTDENVTFEITNVVGQVVYTNNVTAHNGVINEQIQLNGNLTNGMYLLNVHSGSESSVFHFVVEQ